MPSIGTTSSGGGGGGGSQTTPGGVTNSVQTNNGTTNSLGGDSSLLYTTGLLNLTGTLSATTLSATTLSLGGVITNGQVLYLSGTVVDGAAGQNYNRLVDRTFFDEAPAGIATLYTPSTTVLISNSLAVTSFTLIGFAPSRTVTAALEVSGTISGSVVLGARGNFGATTATSGTLNVSGTTPIAIYGGGAGVYHTLGESGVGKLTIKGWNSTSTVDVVDLTGGLSARFYGSGSTSFNGFCVNGGAGCPTALTRDLTFITAGNGAISGSLALGKLTSATTGNILEAVGIISSTGLTVAGPVTGTTANFSGAISVASCTGCGGGGGGGTLISTTTFTAATNISRNTVIGYQASSGTGTINNTVYGSLAGGAFTAGGDNNTFIGELVGVSNTTGTNNVVIGQASFNTQQTGSQNVVIGNLALAQADGAAGNVAIGYGAGNGISSGTGNTFIGMQAGGPTTGINNIVIGNGQTGGTSLGSSTSWGLNIGSAIWGDISSSGGSFAASGNKNLIGINQPAPTAALEVSGTVKLDSLASSTGTNAVCWNSTSKVLSFGLCATSDERLKKNIADITYGLATVNALHPVGFDYKDIAYGSGHQVGFIAQEMFQAVPEVVRVDSEGIWAIDYPKLTAVLAKALQEEDAKYQLLEARVEQLESKTHAP